MASSAFECEADLSAFVEDDDFLLRCASTYNWDVLISRCAFIAEIFSSSIRDRDKQRHEQRKAAASRQLVVADYWGNTPLHMTCFGDPPVEAVNALLNAASGADPPIQITLSLTKDMSSPLLVAAACATSNSASVIRALLYPPGGLISGSKLARQCDVQGETALSALCNRYELGRKHSDPALEEMSLVADGGSELFNSFWSNVEAVLEAAWQNSPSSSREPYISVLHACAALADSCPQAISQLVCRSFPHMSAFSNRKGILPLHLAVSLSRCGLHPKMMSQGASMIDCLLEHCPGAARIAMPETGRNAFCAAIASGLHWSIQYEDVTGPLERIWQCAPEALPSRDVVTGLYPFLLAATLESGDEAEDAYQIGTIFCLLKAYPQLIQELLL